MLCLILVKSSREGYKAVWVNAEDTPSQSTVVHICRSGAFRVAEIVNTYCTYLVMVCVHKSAHTHTPQINQHMFTDTAH